MLIEEFVSLYNVERVTLFDLDQKLKRVEEKIGKVKEKLDLILQHRFTCNLL
jgi:hypothetical protein